MRERKKNTQRSGFVVLVLFLFFLFIFPASLSAKNIYKKQLRASSRTKEVYQRDDLFASVRWHVTYQTPEFVQAKAEKMAKFYKYEGQKKQDLIQAERAKFDAYTAFYISFYAYDYKYADISNQDNHWKLYLEADGERFEPVKFERIEKVTPLYEVLYPYSNVWSRHYYVFFPKLNTDSLPVKLIVTGPTGSSELKW
ncbi:MAG: hypothetical protein HQM16_04150 [Deltaproteobacteria bacterium]|nr:hypothetical protein [Deltaproteobacteria bacterium]